jgi:spore protease
MQQFDTLVDLIHPRTDLALEESERLRGQTQRELPGVEVKEERREQVNIARIRIFSAEGERVMGKVQGNYVTIEAPRLKLRDTAVQEEAAQACSQELKRLMEPHFDGTGEVLVVGLGNWQATPDALGPHVVENLLITRHLRDYVPKNLASRLRPVCAIAPGVLGITGIESSDIIAGIVGRVRPALIIVIDALAARNVDRIITSIQLSDTGIHPGSGVGNRRVGLTQQTLGVPVLAIGVPTVVHAITIAANAIDLLVGQLRAREEFYAMLSRFDGPEQRRLVDEVLSPSIGDLMVTPKEIDVYIEDMARLLAGALNTTLQPGVSHDEVRAFLH